METSETTALAKSEPQTQRGILTREALRVETEQRKLLAEYISVNMQEGTDFGKIPGTPKPTLLKPGAEKLVDLFRCTPKFALVKSEEDFEKGFFNYMFRVRLYQRDSEAVLAEGFGSANSREGRYRWRDAQRKCPKCAKATIYQSKKDGEGFFCWKKKGGCGAVFEADAPAIVSQVSGKVENDDIATMANTILKMAKKRALVDGAIALARCSDMFTQDVEDFADQGAPMPDEAPQERPRQEPPRQEKPKQEPKPAGEKRAAPQASAKKAIVDVRAGESETDATARTVRASRIWTRAKALGMTEAQFPEWVGHVLGGKKRHADWTLADIEALEADLRDMDDGKKGSNEPPPPTDADAPH